MHLGFNTSYNAYRHHLETTKFINGKSAMSIIENSKFFVDKSVSCWSDLENSLTFDFQKYVDNLLWAYDRNLYPYNEEKSREQMKAASEFEKNKPEKIALDFTNEWFLQWILMEYYNKVDDINKQYNGILRQVVQGDSIYSNFNYTPTLESLFGVKEVNILYIHNRFPFKPTLPFTFEDLQQDIVESGRKKIQFGSTKNNLDD